MLRNKVTDIFFDLDHTLWDFEKNSALTFDKILPENGVSVDLPAFLATYMPINRAFWKLYREGRIEKGRMRYLRLKETFDGLNMVVADAVINQLAEEYITYLSSFTHVFPGTEAILKYLRPNYRLHIITNGFEEVQYRKLRNANIHQFFDQIINSEMAGVKKPDPKIFKMALKKAQVNPDRAVMIGDDLEADIMGAQGVGLHTIHFDVDNEARHEHGPIINALSEIKKFL